MAYNTIFITSLDYAILFVTRHVPKSGAGAACCRVFSTPELSLDNATFTDKSRTSAFSGGRGV